MMMFSLFLLLFLSSSITAHTSLRVRLTERALPVVKSFGLQFLEELLNKPFPDFTLPLTYRIECTIKGFTLTNLSVNPDQINLRFMENSGLKFEITDLHFTAQLRREVNVCLWGKLNLHNATTSITGRGVNATLNVTLYQEKGKLKVQIPNCEFRTDALNLDTDSYFGQAIDFVLMRTGVIETQICPAVQSYVIPKVDSMLENLTMFQLNEEYDINIKNLVSADVTVTPRSIDVPFRSIVFWREEADNPPIAGTDLTRSPVIPGSDLMAYVAISDSFLRSITESLYRAGPFHVKIPKGDAAVNFTEAPTVSISQRGVSVTVKASIQSLVQPEKKPLSVDCDIKLVFYIRGTKLFPALFGSIKEGSCKVTTGNFFIEGLANVILKLISLFDVGEELPIPKGLSFTQSKILNNDGYMVVGGSLGLDAAVAQRAAKLLTKVM